ncbi:MAG: hypothetical protein ACR2MS_07725 [Weeksellaceae bacterium]
MEKVSESLTSSQRAVLTLSTGDALYVEKKKQSAADNAGVLQHALY